MEFVGIPMMAYDQISERYFQMLETDPVHNYVQMQQEYHKLKDLYFKYMEQQAEEMTQGYSDLHARVDAVKTEADKYPREWNTRLYSKIDDKVNLCKKFVVSKVDIPDYEIRCRRSGLQLRDIANAINLLPSLGTEVDVMETEIHTSDPTPKPQPTPKPGPSPQPQPAPQPKPTERKLRSQLPTGQLSVAQYKQWLKQQLAMVNQFDTNDILKFDE